MNNAATIGLAVSAFALSAAVGHAEISDGKVKLGVLTDLTGTYSDASGEGSVEAVRMAIEEFGGTVAGMPVELVSADHQNKPEIGSNIVNQWLDVEQVDTIIDVPTSSVALAVQEITRNKERVFLVTGGGTDVLTGAECSPTTAHWAYDTYALAQGMGRHGVQNLGKSWYFLSVDYAFGTAMEKALSEFLTANGGDVSGSVRHALGNTDFSSFLLQAQSSGSDVIALANAGADTINSVKQAYEFGIPQGGQKLAALLMFPTDVSSLGLEVAQTMTLVEGFNAERDDESRAFANAFIERTGKLPSVIQAGAYSAARHYLKAIEALGSDKALDVMAQMRETPVDDAFAKNGTLREDGRMVHDMYLMQVKAPAESTGPWDLYKVLATIPGDEAFRSLEDGQCPLVGK